MKKIPLILLIYMALGQMGAIIGTFIEAMFFDEIYSGVNSGLLTLIFTEIGFGAACVISQIINDRKMEIKEHLKIKLPMVISIFLIVAGYVKVSVHVLFLNVNYTDVPEILCLCIVLQYIVTIIVNPILEEYIFRYHILTLLNERKGKIVAILVSSLLFALLHLSSWQSVLSAFIGGLFFAYIYVTFRRLIYPILGHIFYNLSYELLMHTDVELFIRSNKLSIVAAGIMIFGVILFIFSKKKVLTAESI